MSDSILTTVDKVNTPGRKTWVQQFNQYRANHPFIDAVRLIWDDWNTSDNIFFEVLPNPESLTFSLLTYIPDRAAAPVVSAAPVPIKWNDPPIYDTYSNAWNGIYTWNCADWRAWHVALETHFQSTKKANGIWESAWLHDDNYCILLGSYGCPQTSTCRGDCDFVKYFASKDMTIGNLFSNVVCDLSNVVLNLTETVVSASDGVKNTAKTISTLLPIVAVGYGVSKIYKEI